MCVFVVVMLMFFHSVFLFVSLFLCVFCCYLSFVLFFQDISLNTYVIEAVGFSDLSMILVNLWKT